MKRNLVLTAVMLMAATLTAAAPNIPSNSRIEQVLKEVSQKQKETRSLQADFRQEKTNGLLADPQVSSGTFVYVQPNNVLWKYEQPVPVTMVISGGMLTTYYPELRKAEKLEVKSYEDRIFKYMGAGNAIDELSNYFNFRFIERKGEPYYRLELKPKTKVVERRVRSITIWIDRETYLTSKIEYVESDGDVTRYEFSNLRLNENVGPERFTLKLPSSVRVETMRLD